MSKWKSDFPMGVEKYTDDQLYDAAIQAYVLDGEEKLQVIDELLRRWMSAKDKVRARGSADMGRVFRKYSEHE